MGVFYINLIQFVPIRSWVPSNAVHKWRGSNSENRLQWTSVFGANSRLLLFLRILVQTHQAAVHSSTYFMTVFGQTKKVHLFLILHNGTKQHLTCTTGFPCPPRFTGTAEPSGNLCTDPLVLTWWAGAVWHRLWAVCTWVPGITFTNAASTNLLYTYSITWACQRTALSNIYQNIK